MAGPSVIPPFSVMHLPKHGTLTHKLQMNERLIATAHKRETNDRYGVPNNGRPQWTDLSETMIAAVIGRACIKSASSRHSSAGGQSGWTAACRGQAAVRTAIRSGT